MDYHATGFCRENMNTAVKRLIHYLMRSIPGVLQAGVPVFFSLCIAALLMYGSAAFSDRTLIILLNFLRYGSSVLALLSLFALCYSIQRLARQKLKRIVFYIIAYFLSGIFGMVLAIICTLITVISGGT